MLWEEDEQPINDIGKKLMLGINTTSPLIKRMEKLELVTRRDGETDKHQQIVYLTRKGKDMKRKVAKIPDCLIHSMENNGLQLSHLTAMIPSLDEFIEKMSKKGE